jgi:glutamyl-tRNA synthetase
LRTALYNYLLAKKHHGTFILRIEDTDQSRKVDGAMENLISTLQWAGVIVDEGPGTLGAAGPYIQSQRLALYKEHALRLIEQGDAYYCFCTSARLEKLREEQTAAKLSICYDRHCRDLELAESKRRVAAGESFVIRMKMPLDGQAAFNDLIRGDVTIAYSLLDDQVLLKSDGFPTYHLAVVVDDHHMNISHVIRGEEWLPSTPKHITLYKFFGWQTPLFAHLPLLLNPDKSKLSKRQGDVAVEEYKAKGYLKEALINFIALLGWNPGDEREIFSLEELIHEFSLERVGKSGAVFNVDKLLWLNQQHLRLKSDAELLDLVRPVLQSRYLGTVSGEYMLRVIALMKERAVLVDDFVTTCPYFFTEPRSYDEKAAAKNWTPDVPERIEQLAARFAALDLFTAENTEKALREEAEVSGVGAGKLIHPLRLAVTGVPQGPSLFRLIEVLGRETTIRRMRQAIAILGTGKGGA